MIPNKKIAAIIKKIKIHDSLPILGTVMLDNDKIYVSNLTLTLCIPFQTGVHTCISIKKFIFLLEKYPSFTFTMKRRDLVEVQAGEDKISINTYDPGEFIKPLNPDQFINQIEIEPEDMSAIIEAAAFVGMDELRYVLTGILISDHIVATDAHILFFQQSKSKIIEESIIPNAATQILNLLKKQKWTFDKLSTNPNIWARFSTEGLSLVVRLIEGRFPNYKGLIAKSHAEDSILILDRERLNDAVAKAKFFTDPVIKKVSLIVDQAGCRIFSEFGEEDFTCQIDPISSDVKIKRSFNGNFMIKILKGIEKKTVSVRIIANETPASPYLVKPLILESKYLLMPIADND